MGNIVVMPMDAFNVINRSILYNDDYKILTMLYQPIIGSIATNLYLTLWSYLDKQEFISTDLTHHQLLKSMQLNLEKIIEARESLEAIGLLKTYLKESKEGNSYVYELYSPLRVYDFFADPILSTILHDTIGNNEYKRLKDYFKIPKVELKEYKDITTSFNDVFKAVNIMDIDDIDDVKRENRLGIAYEPTIDMNNVLGLIPEQLINIKSINKNIKELIYKLALVYNYDDDQIREVIMSSINEGHKIDIQKLEENARKLYKFETGNGRVGLLYQNQPDYLKTKLTTTSARDKMIYRFETESPYEFLANKNGCDLGAMETDILHHLLVDIKLNPGVVNVLIDYVLRTSENKLVKSFIESKALEWKRNKIETVPDAMKAAQNERKKKVSNNTTKKEVKEPVWMNKEIDSEELTPEEEQAFREKLKNME